MYKEIAYFRCIRVSIAVFLPSMNFYFDNIGHSAWSNQLGVATLLTSRETRAAVTLCHAYIAIYKSIKSQDID